MKPLFLLAALLGMLPGAQALNLTFAWDPVPASANILAFRLYETTSGLPLLVAATAGSNFMVTVSNYQANAVRTFTATASNLLGESLPSVPVSVPTGPTAPTNITLKVSSIDVPVPGVIEVTRDLASWRERIRIKAAGPGVVNVSLVQYATEPLWLARSASVVEPAQALPLPR